MQILVWLLCLYAELVLRPILSISMAQNPEDDEPAFSETPEDFVSFCNKGTKHGRIDR